MLHERGTLFLWEEGGGLKRVAVWAERRLRQVLGIEWIRGARQAREWGWLRVGRRTATLMHGTRML